ncbi:MAG: hypothetical protein ACK5Q5_05645 [Planctomycetaceae bacterium]
MTNAITINGSVNTRNNGIGAALCCVAVVGRDVRACHERLCDVGTPHRPQRDLLHLHKPGKQLDAAPSMSEGHRSASSSSASASFTESTVTMPATTWQRPYQATPRPAAAAEVSLPSAAWASLVIARAISA